MKNEPYYQHGGNPRLDLARLNLTERSVLDFSVNLNPLGTPELLRRGWEKLLEAVGVYPPVYGDGVAHYYREKFGIPSKNFLAGNGSTEMIYLVPRVLGLKRVMILTPSYHDYERASILAGAKVTRHNLSPEMNFSLHDHGDMDPDLNDLNGLWLARPNNPTGILFPKRLILELSDRFPNHMFIVDEAFIQFQDIESEDACMKLVQESADRLGLYLMNSVNPFRLEGQKAIMYRVLQGLNWEPPDWIVVPGGNLGNSRYF